MAESYFNPLSVNLTKWSKKNSNNSSAFAILSEFDHFVGLALKGLSKVAGKELCADIFQLYFFSSYYS